MLDTDVALTELRSLADLQGLDVPHRRLAYERFLAEGRGREEEWTHPGFCLACEQAVALKLDWVSSNTELPNFRERLLCPRCGLNNRQRFLAGLVRERTTADTSIYLYEQITQFYDWAVGALPGTIAGSEYLGHDRAGGDVVAGIRHEDAMAMTYADDTFDVLVSQDVFEHVPDIGLTLAEASRVLRPGGWMWFSVPFHSDRVETVRRAELRAGQVVELLPPQYHGNPVDAEAGSLVFYDHGWGLLDACRDAGFADAHVIAYWSALHGHLGGGLQMVFAAQNG